MISQMQANITLKIFKHIQDQKCRLENLEIKSNIEWSVMQIALIHAPFLIIKIKEPSNLQNKHNPPMSSRQYLMLIY